MLKKFVNFESKDANPQTPVSDFKDFLHQISFNLICKGWCTKISQNQLSHQNYFKQVL